MSINGKSKGSSFERVVSKQLTVWASGQSEKLWFWRAPASGGMAKIYADLSGDIVALVPEAEPLTNLFSIEIKHHKDVNLFDYWNKSSKVNSFWKQCCDDASRANKWPLLIMKITHKNIFVGVSNNIEIENTKHINIAYHDMADLNLYLYDDFFSIVTFDYIKQIDNHNITGES